MSVTWGRQDAISPQEHAAVILEVCGGDLREAQDTCFSNVILGDPTRSRYWCEVLRSLRRTGSA